MPRGTPGADTFTAPAGNSSFDGLGGVDTITFNFALTDAAFTWIGNQVIVDTATSHTVLTGFEKYVFTDGTVNDDDGDPLVDDLYYYARYHDVWNAHVDADLHYHLTGWNEGRDPDAFFSTSEYLTANPDIKAAGVDPLIQFDQTGWLEGRLPSINFDPQQYLLANPDVKAAGVDPLKHFLEVGGGEGRQPFAPLTFMASNGFDYIYYLQHNPDVAKAGADPYLHYETVGWKEGRNPNAYFDTQGYLATYTDVARAGVNPLDHFHQSGWQEGRISSPLFDPQQYLAHNPDVAAAHVDPLLHYLQSGIYEGRTAYALPVVDIDGSADSVIEGAAAGTHVGVTVAWGGWKSPSLFYTLAADSSGGGFAVNAGTGVITVLDGSKIDFENAPRHAYTVTVTAHDAGQTSTQTFTIAVADAAPALPVSQAPVGDVDELAANGSTVGITFTATDPNGPSATYSLSDDAGGRFAIDPHSGVVTVANGAAIDYESAPGHAYAITAVAAAGALSTSQTFTINVNDVNEAPTAVAFANATSAIDEKLNVGAGIKVADIVVTDDTLGANVLSLSGADKGSFEIRNGHELYFIGASPDFETKSSYAATVSVDDASVGGSPDAGKDFTLRINDLNEAPTALSLANVTAAIDENTDTKAGIKVADIQVTDDALGTDLLGLSGSDSAWFEIRNGHELYFVGAAPDFETKASYSVTVNVDDATVGGGPDASRNFTLAINDVNEAPAAVSFANVTASIDENTDTSTGIKVADIAVSDDALGSNALSLTGADSASFEIRNGHELYFVGAAPDFESKASYSVTVNADDATVGGSPDASRDFTLAINDVNEAPAALSFANVTASIDESTDTSGGIKVAEIVVTDDALGINLLTLSGADKDSFELRGASLYYVGASPDFETKSSYAVTVNVDDLSVGASPDLTKDFTLTINDVNEAPTALSFAHVTSSLDENTTVGSGIKVADLLVTDDALGANVLSLSGDDAASFAIRNGNELFYIGNSPDFEAKSSYSVTVSIDDASVGAAPDASQDFTLTINDVNEAPTAVSFANVTSVDENTDTSGGIKVADIVVTDDALGTNVLTLSGAASASFAIRNGTELFYVGNSPDFETKSGYHVTVKVDDASAGGNPDASQDFTLAINDVNEAPTALSFAKVTSIDENTDTSAGIKVADIAVSDDALGTNVLSLSGTDAASFAIRNGNQLFYVGNSPDFEAKSSYSVTVSVDDASVGSRPDAAKDFTLVINDLNEAPTAVAFANAIATLDENVTVGTGIKVADIVVSDDTLGTNVLSLSGDDAISFALRNGTELFYVGNNPDFEAKSSYSVTVSVDDASVGGSPDASQDFTLAINDRNEAPSAISFANAISLDENVGVGTGIKVADIVVTDDALGTNVLSLSGADAASFAIRNGTELFYVGNSPDFEAKPSYSVTLSVDDASVGASPDASQDFTLTIGDVNEGPSAVSLANVTAAIDENVTVGTGIKVADIVVTDDALGTDLLSLSGADAASFAIRNGHELYYVGVSPDFEAKSSYSVTVDVDDTTLGGSPDASQSFTLTINDVNEAPTAVAFANATATLDENVTVGTGIKVADIVVTDDALGTEVLSLSGADSAAFAIRNGHELYYVGASPDFEVKPSYTVTVSVNDASVGASPDASQDFTLTIGDVNEVPSAVSFANVISLDENVTVGTGIKVADIVVADDALGTDVLSLSGADAASFAIRNGQLFYIDNSPDFEAKPGYSVTISVDDASVGGTPDASQDFTLSITDVNEAPTAVSFANATAALDENVAVGTGIKVADIVVIDDALGTNALSLSGSDAASFTIRNGNQLYYIGTAPDFEAKSSYSVTVSVDDPAVGATPDASQDFTLSINNLNEAPSAVSFANAISLDENSAVGTGIKVADIVVSDDALGTDMLSLSGADATSFAIRNGNQLYYIGAAPDFEVKSSYSVTVSVDDPVVGGTPDASQAFTLSINDVNEAPTAVAFANATTALDENVTVGTGIKVADIVVTDDALGTNVLSLSGVDAASFAIRNGNQLYYIGASPDFETKSSYSVTVSVDDTTVGSTPDASQDFTLAITDVNEAPTAVAFANSTTALDENVTVGSGIKVADILVTDDTLGTDVLSLSGTDAASFAIRNGNQLYYVGASPNFEVKSSYHVTVNVDDSSVGGSPDASQDFTLAVNDKNDPPVVTSGPLQSGTVLQGANPVTQGNLILSSGFEAPYWLQGWTVSGSWIGSGTANGAHSGQSAFFANTGAGRTLALTNNVSTVAGKTYTLDFWLKNDAGTSNDFTVSWNGQVLNALHNVTGNGQYTEYSYTVTGAAGTSQLAYTFHDDTSVWHLDDVTVQETGNRLLNGGFDFGFSDWTTTPGGQFDLSLANSGVTSVPSAEFFASSGHGPSTVSQSFATVPGMTYTVSFWVSNVIFNNGPNTFTAKWDGTPLLSLTNAPQQGFTHYSYEVTATGSTTQLSFVSGTNSALYFLDDVSVTRSGESTSGTITFTDEDTADTHTVSATENGSGYIGALTPVLVTDSTGGQTGVVNWTYVVSDVVLANKVAPQTSIQQSYTVNIDDHHGGVTPQTVTVTITNPDHAPVITGSTDGGVVESFTQPVPTGNLVANPGFEFATIVNPQTGQAVPNNWTLGGDTSRVQPLGFQHSGFNALQFTFTGGSSVSQTLTTVAGLTYSLDFWLDNAVNLTGVNNTTTVSINGTTIYTLTNVPGDAIYRQYHVDFVASSTSSTLTFNVVNPVSYQAIDDVSVKATGIIPGQESAQGTVSFTDLDLADTHTVTVTPAVGGYVGSFTAATSTESGGGSTGTVGWNFTVLDAALAFIPAQQSVTQTYTITVDDGRGGRASRDVNVTLTNPEQPPVITGSTNGTVQRDVSLEIPADSIVNGGFEVGLNNFPPDMPGWSFGGARSAFIYGGSNQVHSGAQSVNFFSGTTLNQTVWTVAGQHYTLNFFLSHEDLQSRPNDFTVSWNGASVDSYTNVPLNYDTQTASYLFTQHTYDLVGTGGPVTLTFSGSNPAGWLIDDVSLVPATLVTRGTETTSGTVSFTDPESTDTHTVTYSTPVGSSYRGSFAVALGSDSTGGVTGKVNWTFSVSDTALAFLAAQQSVTQTYTVTVADNHGGRTNRDVTMTLTNPDHAPAVTGSTDGSVSRDTQHVVASGNLILNGGFDDVFDHWSFGPNNQAQVTFGLGHTSPNVFVGTDDHFLSQSFATTPGLAYQVDFWLANYDSTIPNSTVVNWNGNTIGTVQDLPGSINPAGDHLTYTHYVYTAVATSAQSTLNFAFHHGQFFLDDVAVNSVSNTESTYGTIAFTDVDTIDTHTVSFQPQGSNYVGTFAASIAAGDDTTGGNPGAVTWTFSVPDSALTGLSAQQSVVQTYTVTIADNHGGSTTRDVAVTLTNPDHAPAVTPTSQTGSWIANHSSTTPPGNVLPNGGFETFSYDQNGLPTIFPGWTTSGFLYPPEVGVYPHSGGSVVDFATNQRVGTLSTTVPTIAGVHYTLDFWAAAAFSSNNSIAVSWNGQTVLARSNVTPLAGHNPTGPGDYIEYSADVVGAASSSSLVFSLSTAYYWFLDDITVIPVSSGAITFTDPESSDTHTISVAPNSNLGTLSISLGADSTGGQTGRVNWSYSVADSAFVSLAAGQSTVETFTVLIKDGQGGQTTQDVAVTVYGINDAPTLANAIADQRAALNAPFSFQLPVNTFHDVDTGDTLTYSATLADGSALPAWLHFDPVTRSFSGNASASDPPIDVKVTATDGGGLSVSDTFTIKVDQPAVFGAGGGSGTIAEVVGVPAAGAQLSTGASSSFSDADPADAHHLVSATGSFNAGASSNAPSALGTLTASITHDTVNGAGGQLSWTYTVDASAIEYLAPGQTRVEAFDVSVADDLGAVGTKTILVTLTGVNDPPVVANPIPDQPATSDSPFLFQFAANAFTDVDGDTLGYSAMLADGSAWPAWLNFDAATRTFSGTPHFGDGRIDVTVTASDGQLTASDTFTILLPVFNKAPVLAALPGPGQTLTKTATDDISSTAKALVLDGHLGLGADPNIAFATTIPHVSIAAAGGGTLDYYKFTVAAGARGIFDIDGGYDSAIELIDSNGNMLTWDDDSLVTDGAGGSPLNQPPNTTYDSFLDYTFATGGTYYLVVGGFNGSNPTPANIDIGQPYQLQVSLSSVDLGPKLDPYVINGAGPSGTVGTRVSSLVDLRGNGGHDNVNDPDANGLTGIALSGADSSHGTWWFSLDDGASWNPVGNVDEQHALLLAADAGTRLYFQPAGGLTGTVNNAITFHAWDQTSGTAGQTADASVNGGASAFSTATNTLSIRNVDLAPTDIAWGGVSPSSGTAFPGAGTTIANLQAVDPDDSSGFSYTLTGSSSNFAVSSGGAVSKVTSFSTGTTYTLDVQVADSSGLTFTKHFTIITGGTGNDTLTGTSGDDIFYGRQGDDIISGGGGNDTLFGQDGNDTLRGGAGHNVIDGGAGVDSLDLSGATSAVSFTLTQSGSDTVVDLTAFGLGVDTYRNMEGVVGSAFADTLNGSGGNDVLNGGAGADSLSGAGGNDTLVGDQSDTLLDGGLGTDTLQIGASFASSNDGQIINIENITLTASGTTLNLSNQSEGFTITGSSGADNITGGAVADTITGGAGTDSMTGGGGGDTFKFSATSESSIAASDVIADFVHGVDKIDLSAIDAKTQSGFTGDQAFLFGGQNANTVANSITWSESGGNTILHIDNNGNTAADMQIILTGINLGLTQNDFLL